MAKEVESNIRVNAKLDGFNKAMKSMKKQCADVKTSLSKSVGGGLSSVTSGLSNIQSMSGNVSNSLTGIASKLGSLGPIGAVAGAALSAIGAGIASSQTLSDLFARTWEQIKGVIGTVATAVGQLLNGDFAQAWETFKQAGEAADEAGKLADALDELGTQEIEYQSQTSRLNALIEEQKAIINDETNSIKDRQNAQKELSKLTDEYAQSAERYKTAASNTYQAYTDLLVKQSGLSAKFTQEEKAQIQSFLSGQNGGVNAMKELGDKWAKLADTISDDNIRRLNGYNQTLQSVERNISSMSKTNSKMINRALKDREAIKNIDTGEEGSIKRQKTIITELQSKFEIVTEQSERDKIKQQIDSEVKKLEQMQGKETNKISVQALVDVNGVIDAVNTDFSNLGIDELKQFRDELSKTIDAISDFAIERGELFDENELSYYDALINKFNAVEEKTKQLTDEQARYNEQAERLNKVQSDAQAMSTAFATASQSLDAFAESSDVAAGAQKGLAVASQMAAFASAVAEAAKLPFPSNLPAMATAAASAIAVFAQMQKFSDGGIVQGDSFHGDTTTVRVNKGEMILNNSQQSRLFSLLNSTDNVNNNSANNVKFTLVGKDLIGSITNTNKTMNRLR